MITVVALFFQNIMDEIQNYGDVIQQLHEQASQLGEQVAGLFYLIKGKVK